jgi:hypothetical protein
LRERDARDKLNENRQALFKKGLAKDDGDIEQIEKVMLEKNIPSHETAAEYWKWMQQSAAPTPGTSYNPSTFVPSLIFLNIRKIQWQQQGMKHLKHLMSLGKLLNPLVFDSNGD